MSLTPEQAFGQVLREIRKEQGLSQDALSSGSQRHSTYIRILEQGKKSPTIKTVFALAEVLGIPPSEIFRRVEKLMKKDRKR